MKTSRIASCLLLLVITAASLRAKEPIFPTGAVLELLFTRTAVVQFGLTEGPAAAPDGSIYFTDIPLANQRSMIMHFDPKTLRTAVFSDSSGKANGMKFDAQGDLIVCEGADYGGRRVARWNVTKKTRETIATTYQGKRFNSPNDLDFDSQGRIYFTDPRYAGHESRELAYCAVYRIDTDGTVVEVTHDVEQPNGIALSPDCTTLYIVDHNNGAEVVDPLSNSVPIKIGAMKVYSFPLGGDGLVNGPRKTLIDFGTENGCDGMLVDSEGRLFLASRTLKRPGILVVDSNGEELDFLPTGPPNQHDAKQPVGIPSNCEFGVGDESNMLYVTADKSLFRVRVNARRLTRSAAK